MTPIVKQYVKKHRHKMHVKNLEVGSYNVNGTVRSIIPVTIGIDIRPGPMVDVVLAAEDLPKRYLSETFSSVISTETLEHIEHWREALYAMWDMLRTNGYMLITMASMRKGCHDYPNDFWRLPIDQVTTVFPTAEDITDLGISIGWIARKTEPLPNLHEIDLIPVGDIKKGDKV